MKCKNLSQETKRLLTKEVGGTLCCKSVQCVISLQGKSFLLDPKRFENVFIAREVTPIRHSRRFQNVLGLMRMTSLVKKWHILHFCNKEFHQLPLLADEFPPPKGVCIWHQHRASRWNFEQWMVCVLQLWPLLTHWCSHFGFCENFGILLS